MSRFLSMLFLLLHSWLLIDCIVLSLGLRASTTLDTDDSGWWVFRRELSGVVREGGEE
jgi:hypothetical protein